MMTCKFHNLPNKNVRNYGFIPLARGSVRWIFMNSSLFSPAACIDAFPRCPFVACTFLSPFLYSFKIRKGCLLNLETSSVCERWGSCTKDPTSRIGFRIYDPSGQFTLVVTRWSCRNSSLDLRSAALFASSSSGVFSWPVIETFYNKRKKKLCFMEETSYFWPLCQIAGEWKSVNILWVARPPTYTLKATSVGLSQLFWVPVRTPTCYSVMKMNSLYSLENQTVSYRIIV